MAARLRSAAKHSMRRCGELRVTWVNGLGGLAATTTSRIESLPPTLLLVCVLSAEFCSEEKKEKTLDKTVLFNKLQMCNTFACVDW